MIELIAGNLCSLLAMTTDVISSSRKTAKGVLLVQSVSQLIYCIGSILLKGYSAAVQNGVSVFRNLFAVSGKESKLMEWAFVILGVVLGLYLNNRGIFGWLPVIANLEYSLAVFRFKDNEWALKLAFFISIVLYTMFCFVILNFVGIVTNTVVLITTGIFLVKGRKKKA